MECMGWNVWVISTNTLLGLGTSLFVFKSGAIGFFTGCFFSSGLGKRKNRMLTK